MTQTSVAAGGLRRLWRVLFPFCLVALFVAPAGADEPVRFSILPQWAPQAQFAGVYVAKAKGFYAARGVDMTILRGGPKAPSHSWLAEGRADFATLFLTTALKLADSGVRLVDLAQLVKRSSLMLVAKKKRGVLLPRDLDGKRISAWEADLSLQIQDFLRKNRASVTTLPQGWSVNLFLRDGVDAVAAMWYNEYHAILNAGLNADELTVFPMAEYGLNFPEDGLYCLRETYEKHPQACCAAAEATLEGWRYAFAHPEEALDLVMEEIRRVNLPTNRAHQRWMLARMRDIMAPTGERLSGTLTENQYLAAAEAMRKAGMIAAFPAYKDFYVDCDAAR